MKNATHLAIFLIAAAVTAAAAAQEFEFGGSVSLESRWFPESPLHSEQLDDLQSSLVVEPWLTLESDDRRHRIHLAPFARLDDRDDERSHVDLREASWRGIFGDVEIVGGVGRVFWGVTESRHLVDVVNQTDVLEDIDGEDKLGQPMIGVEWQRNWGRLSAWALFGFREREYPGPDGRLRLPLPISEHALFPDGERDVDFALRYVHYLGDVDLGISLFHGTEREPTFWPDSSGDQLIPVYSEVTRLGVDLQYTRNAWLFKLEALGRDGNDDSFGAAVAGFEYTLFQLGGTATDFGLLAEYLRDERDEHAPPTTFDDDIFVGARLAWNDTADTSLLVGAVIDRASGEVAARIEGSRRLTDHLVLDLEASFFLGVERDDSLSPFRRDDFVTLSLAFFP